jgi:diacylglycerol O-acyltransferase / wax synthase
MQRISATDAMFLDIEGPKSPLIIGGLFILDPSTAPGSFVRHRDILTYVESRLHLAPNLRRKLVYHPLGLDEPRLIDDPDFDLEFHVRHIALPRPRDLRQLKILASRVISRPMDLHRPLWEMYIIEGLEAVEGAPSDAFAMLFKMHHATFDGKAGGAALWAFMQDTPEFAPTPPEKRWVPDRVPDAVGWTLSSVQEGIKQLVSNTRSLPSLGKGLWDRAGLSAAEGPAEPGGGAAPRTRFQQKLTSHRVFDWVRWEMAEVQELRAALGKPKMNDLLVAVVGGALRRYLDRHHELPQRSLMTFCPISVRGAGDPREGGNQVSGMRATLGTDIADPLGRLAAVAASTKSGKAQIEALGGDFMGSALALTPYFVRSRTMKAMTALADRFDLASRPVANTVITNAPNPPAGHYFTGAKVLSYAGFGPVAEGIGIFHTITGMDFEVTISVTSCRELLPDLSFYMECLRESFAELQAATTAQDAV